MDDRLNLKIVVDEANVPADGDIAMVSRGRRQTAPEVVRHRVHSLSQILVEHGALSQSGFLIGGEPILAPKPCRRMVLVLVVPVAGGLTIFVVKLRVAMTALVAAILGESSAGAQNEQSSGDDSCQRMNSQENTFLMLNFPSWAPGSLQKYAQTQSFDRAGAVFQFLSSTIDRGPDQSIIGCVGATLDSAPFQTFRRPPEF
jgi:hypothetical protein